MKQPAVSLITTQELYLNLISLFFCELTSFYFLLISTSNDGAHAEYKLALTLILYRLLHQSTQLWYASRDEPSCSWKSRFRRSLVYLEELQARPARRKAEYNLSEEAKPKFLEAARMQHRQIYSRSASRLSTVCVFRARITIQPAAWGKKGHVSLPGEVLVLDLINYRQDLSLV